MSAPTTTRPFPRTTPGAVSQQVKLLEDWLGVRLFERRAGGVALTAAGTQLQQTASRSLRALAQAAERLRPDARTVRVSGLVSFAARWLLPRLDGFTRLHPSIQVQIDATNAVADFEHDGVHLAIRHASADPVELDWHELVRERLWPVCTPAYARLHVRRGRLLASARLLHELDGTYAEYWGRWIAEHADGEPIEAAGGPFFSHEMLAHDAARAGQGVALANPFLVAPELASGALQVAVDAPLSTGKRYSRRVAQAAAVGAGAPVSRLAGRGVRAKGSRRSRCRCGYGLTSITAGNSTRSATT